MPRQEKLRLVQFLIGEIAREENLPPFEFGAAYPVWSPYNAFEAAVSLQNLLEQDKREHHG